MALSTGSGGPLEAVTSACVVTTVLFYMHHIILIHTDHHHESYVDRIDLDLQVLTLSTE